MTELYNIINKVRNSSRKLVRELGLLSKNTVNYDLPLSFRHALIELELQGTLTHTELATMLNLDKSTISRLLKNMLQQKLISYSVGQGDQRYKCIRLTETGRTALTKVNTLAGIQVKDALEILSESQRNTVVAGLEIYTKALKLTRVNNEYCIRSIKRTDNSALASVIKEVLIEHDGDRPGTAFGDEELQDLYKAYTNINTSYFVIERKSDKKIMGGCGVGPLNGADSSICELKKMYLLSETRGLGLGQMLLQKSLDAAIEHGYKQCYLETLSNMTSAQRLYTKFGFEPLEVPLGNTGHSSCDVRLIKKLG